MGAQKDRIRFFTGRNFIESLVYTLTYIEFQARLETRRQNLAFLVAELERQLCGLARAIPQVKKIYHDYVRETLREYYKDYPLPQLGPSCMVRDVIIEWFKANESLIFRDELAVEPSEVVAREIERIADNILHQSIMGALYKAGVISHA